MPKISVIIPFNNVESYIKECIESVINQTLKDIEIICVNDASTDNSRNILTEYAKKDNRIKIIDLKTRKGQGYARNRAIEIASGEYIGFVDSDDYIESEMFESLYNKAKENDDDIVICQAREYDDINEKFILSDYYSLTPLAKMEDKVFSARDTKDELLNINVVLWNKIYKKTYLDKLGEKFPEGFIYEDLPFFFGTYLPAERIQIVWENFYIYRINRKNSTMQQFNNKILDRLPMVSLTYEKFKQFDFLSDIMNRIKGWIINDLFHRYSLLKENYQREFFFEMKKIFKSLNIEDIKNPDWKKVYHFEGYLLVLNNDFESFNQKIFTEYLDIHKLEDRLRSEMSNSAEVDKKLSRMYEDINKNNEYFNANINEQISRVYSNIEENRGYITSEVDIKISDVYASIETNKSYINAQTDEKISHVYSYINETNAQNDDKIAKMRLDINYETGSIYEQNAQNYEALNNLIENTAKNIKQTINNETEQKYNTLNEKINLNNREINQFLTEELSKIKEQYEAENKSCREEYKKEINNLKENFSSALNDQKNNYENQINFLNNRVKELEKGWFKKLKDKIKKCR